MATNSGAKKVGRTVILPNYEPWTTVSVTSTLTTNVTTTAKRKVQFENAEYDIHLAFSGVNTQGILAISLPAGDVIDDALLASQANGNLDPLFSNVTITDASGISRYFGRVHLNTTGQVRIYVYEVIQGASNGTTLYPYANLIDTSINRPMQIASGDSISIRFQVPLVRLSGGMSAYGAGAASPTTPSGLITNIAQEIAGDKTFKGKTVIGDSAGLGTAAGAYHIAYGATVGRLLAGSSHRSESAPIQFRLGVNYYLDQVGSAKAITSGGSGFFNIAAVNSAGDEVYTWHTNITSQTADAAITGTMSKIASATAAGAWTFGVSGGTETHTLHGGSVYLNRPAMSSGGQTVSFSALNAGVDLATIGGYRNATLSANVGYFATRNSAGNVIYQWQNGGTWYSSNTATDIGSTSGNVIGSQTSDERLKQNIAPLPYGLMETLALKPIIFDRDGKRLIGFSAQQARGIVPEAVYDTGEKIAEDDESGLTKLSMYYDSLTAVLVNAVKEQQAIIESLTARIEALEA